MDEQQVVEQRIRSLKDADLLAMLDDPAAYTPEALGLAAAEVEHRGGRDLVASQSAQQRADFEAEDRLALAHAEHTRIPRTARIVAWLFLLTSIGAAINATRTNGLSPSLVSPLVNHGTRIGLSAGILAGSPFCLAGMVLVLGLAGVNAVLFDLYDSGGLMFIDAAFFLACAALLASCWTRFIKISAFKRGLLR